MQLKDRLQNIKGYLLIYGAHLVALECGRWLVKNGHQNKVVGFAVTGLEGNPSEIEGLPVKKIEDYMEQCCDLTVIIAMPERYHDEVEHHARNYGFRQFVKLRLEDMAKIKGEELLLEQDAYPRLSFVLEASENDPTWLDMMDQSSFHTDDGGARWKRLHYKFPTLFYLDKETVFAKSETLNLYKDPKVSCGELWDLHALPTDLYKENDERKPQDIMAIYMAFSAWDETEENERRHSPWIRPIQVGSSLSKKRHEFWRDDEGDNISEKNRIFAEMTGAYWVWKNETESDYKGLCHYRRHFIISPKEIMALAQNDIDVLLTIPRYVPGGIKDMFLEETPVKKVVYQGMLRAISEMTPEDRAEFETYMEDCFYYPNNMVIARRKVYDDYCAWMFPILFRMMEIDREIDYGHEEDRHIAYAAELLTSYYFVKNRKEYRIAVTDYQLTSV